MQTICISKRTHMLYNVQYPKLTTGDKAVITPSFTL